MHSPLYYGLRGGYAKVAEKVKNVNTSQKEEQDSILMMDKQKDKVFSTEEIEIEEMTIDGICGVY